MCDNIDLNSIGEIQPNELPLITTLLLGLGKDPVVEVIFAPLSKLSSFLGAKIYC
jgi:hypothetical protein